MKRSSVALVAVVLIGIAAVIGWRLYSGDAPDEVTIGDAVAVVEGSIAPSTTVPPEQATTEPPASSTTHAPAVDGDWSVDTTIGSFSFQDASSTFVGFRVGEELSGVGATEAVGRTPGVTGSMTLSGSKLTVASITADLSRLTTDRSRRDNAVRRALAVAEFPTATFSLTEPVDLGVVPGEGETIAAIAIGELTIRGMTRLVEFAFDAQLVDGVIVVVGRIPVTFADFGVTVPSAPVVLRADDSGVIEVQVFFTR